MSFTTLKRINTAVTKTVGVLMSITVAAMALLIITSVFVRNVMGFSFQWIVDVNRLIFIWMCFLGIVFVNDEDRLIRFEILEQHFSPKVRKWVDVFRYAASLVLYAVMCRAGILVSEFAKAQVFSTIPVSTMWMYMAVVAAGVLLVFQTVIKLLVLLLPGKETDPANKGDYR